METAPVILFVGLLVFLAHLFVALFERFRIPDVLYLIVIGLVVGPLLHIVHPDDFGKVGPVFTTLALVVILFGEGIEINFDVLLRSIRGSLLLTAVSYGIGTLLLWGVTATMTGLPLVPSLYVAAVLAGPAPTVVIPIVRHLRLQKGSRAMLTVESPLGEAVCIVIALAILQSLELQRFDAGHLVGQLLASFVFAVVVGVVGGYFWSLLLNRVRQLRHAMFTTPSFVFVLYGFAELLGFSGPVAALTFGITIGNSMSIRIPWLHVRTKLTPAGHNKSERLFFGEIVFLLKTFFFVYLGISIRFSDFWSMGVATVLTVTLLVARWLSIRLTMPPTGVPTKDALLMSAMVPKGTAAAVLAGIPLLSGIEGGALVQNLIYGVVVGSIFFTSTAVFALERWPALGVARWVYPPIAPAAEAEEEGEGSGLALRREIPKEERPFAQQFE